MIKLWSICRNTFVQTIRQPIYGVLLLMTFLVLVLSPFLTGWTMGDGNADYQATDQKMLVVYGMGTLLFSGLLLAAFSASSAVSREIEDRTALTVISKPVPRATFVLGKFGGVAGAVALAIYLASLVLLMTVRHRIVSSASDPIDMPVIVLGCAGVLVGLVLATVGNIFFGWPFISSLVWSLTVTLTVAMGFIGFIGKGWTIIPFGQGIEPQLPLAIALVFLAVLIFVAVAVAVSTRWGQVLTVLVCLAVLGLGSMHTFLMGNWANRLVLVKMLSPLAPKLTYFYTLDAVMTGMSIPADYVAFAALYCLLYVGGILAVGMALFQRRSLQADGGAGGMPGMVSLLAGAGRLAAFALAVVGLEGVLSGIFAHFDKNFVPLVYDSLASAFSPAMAFVAAGVFILLAAATYALWTYFGRGVRWAYWLVLVLGVLELVRYATGLAVPSTRSLSVIPDRFQGLLAGTIIAGLVVLILVLPSTRRHFRKT